MKNLIVLIVALVSFSANAQRIIAKDYAITVKATSMTVKQAFDLTDKLASSRTVFYDRYVIKNGIVYYRAGISMNKRKAYVMKDGKLIRISI